MSEKVKAQHIARKAMLYIRQSSAYQVTHNRESQKLQYAMQDRLRQLGWREIEVIDEDLGRSAAGTVTRTGFERMVAEVCLGKVGAVAAREVSRFARNSREWQQRMEVCRIVDTLLVDQDTVYAPRQSNDRLPLGLKGSLNEYELDLLRTRSVEARYAKAHRGALLVAAPVGYVKTEDQRPEKDPDRRVQEAIGLVFREFAALGTVRQTLWWFLEHGLALLSLLDPRFGNFSPTEPCNPPSCRGGRVKTSPGADLPSFHDIRSRVVSGRHVPPLPSAPEGRQGAPVLEHRGEASVRRRSGGRSARAVPRGDQ
jgi:DNA invertase Pin-like site-specific DNA recombinase